MAALVNGGRESNPIEPGFSLRQKRSEVDRLMYLKWKIIADHRITGEVNEAKRKMEDLQRKTEKGTKRKGGVDGEQGKQSKRVEPAKH